MPRGAEVFNNYGPEKTNHELMLGHGFALLVIDVQNDFISGTFGLVGLAIAWWLHCANRKAADDLRGWFNGRAWIAWLPRAMEHKWYVDEIYIATIRFPLWIAGQALYMFDRIFVDGIGVNGTARLPKIAASLFQPLYNGKLQGYATSMAGGLALVIAWIVWVWMRGSV